MYASGEPVHGFEEKDLVSLTHWEDHGDSCVKEVPGVSTEEDQLRGYGNHHSERHRGLGKRVVKTCG